LNFLVAAIADQGLVQINTLPLQKRHLWKRYCSSEI